MPNIFLSHNSKDKAIVEPIALKLAQIYGKDSVFYDSWSIQPGDGIIEQMNSGLFKCDFFLFFVSKNSLQSNMVKLEWQNALLKATKNQIKLIPVKLDDCLMPQILLQTLYIDIYGKGLEYGFKQIVDVINGQNVFREQYQTYENMRAIARKKENGLDIEIAAITYFEPISRFLILIDCNPSDISIICTSDSSRTVNRFNGIRLNNGLICNALYEEVSRGLTPGFPYRVVINRKDKKPFKCYGIMRAISDQEYHMIPFEIQE